MSESTREVIVVGAGLAGLSSARLLLAEGIDVRVLEAADAVGGRVRTDEVEGFRLDRGFQVLLAAYEEVQAQVDLDRLDLCPFDPGSLVYRDGALHRLVDPFRAPLASLAGATAPVGSLADKLRVARLRLRLLATDPADAFRAPDRSTLDELRALGFSDDFIDAFFRPFLGGVFLERDLDTSARLFRYYFRCFAADIVAVPARGMQRLPELLAEPLEGRIDLDTAVAAVRGDGVTLEDGRDLSADQVVLATDGLATARLLGTPAPAYKTGITTWFAAAEPPVDAPILVLDGEGTGPANHVAVMSQVSRDYAPAGAHLIAVSGVGAAAEDADAFEAAVPTQLERWFGPTVRDWRTLRTHQIVHALPRHPAGSLDGPSAGRRHGGVILAGDHTEFGSIQGALLSGRKAAEAVFEARG